MSNTCPIEFQYPFRNGRRCCNEPVYYDDTSCPISGSEFEECEEVIIEMMGRQLTQRINCRLDWGEGYFQSYDGIIPTPTPTSSFNPTRIEPAYVPTPTPTTDFFENLDKDTLIVGLVTSLGFLLLLIILILLFGGSQKIKQKIEQVKQ